MFEQILHTLKKPALWRRGTAPFWDDEHISRMMLAAHLDPNLDAASRRHETIDRSVYWLSTLIPGGAKILDLGCGPGLYAKRLSDLGYAVTGVDLSPRSIAYAREQDAKSAYFCLNYLELDYEDAFDAVILIYCDYAALTTGERQRLLDRVYKALKPGGLFLFDVFTDAHFAGKRENTAWSVQENGGFFSAEPHICFTATYLYENHTVALSQYVLLTARGTAEYLVWDTAYNLERLRKELAPSGLEIVQAWDDVWGSPYSDKAETLCVKAVK